MIITSLAGGLGNQLFQYAMARRLAVKHRAELLLDVTNYRVATDDETAAGLARKVHLFDFRIKARPATANEMAQLRDPYSTRKPFHRAIRLARRVWPNFLWRESHIIERQYRFQPEALNFPGNVYLAGFWQSEKYFKDIAPLIIDELQLIDESLTIAAAAKVNELRQKYPAVVSVHVRRGDLAHFEALGQKQRVHSPPIQPDYYRRAMSQFDSSACFFVFSDSQRDLDWCKQHIVAKNVVFSDAESELWDFTAMHFCDHNIIANSTFSWWAAWLNPNPTRRVISPARWSPPEAATQMVTDDLIPSDWMLI